MPEPVADKDILFTLGFALSHKVFKRDLIALAKEHWPDDARRAAALAILEHIRLCGMDVVQVKGPSLRTAPPPEAWRGRSDD